MFSSSLLIFCSTASTLRRASVADASVQVSAQGAAGLLVTLRATLDSAGDDSDDASAGDNP